jgi:hypothetical protein
MPGPQPDLEAIGKERQQLKDEMRLLGKQQHYH